VQSDDELEVETAIVFERFRIHHALLSMACAIVRYTVYAATVYNFEAASFYATYNVMRDFRMQLSKLAS